MIQRLRDFLFTPLARKPLIAGTFADRFARLFSSTALNTKNAQAGNFSIILKSPWAFWF